MEYKLKYSDRETAIKDLVARGIYIETEFEGVTWLYFGQGIDAIVEAGIICLTQPTFDEDGKELTPAVYAEGYHFDILTDNVYEFGTIRIFPKNSRYTFAGINENPITDETII